MKNNPDASKQDKQCTVAKALYYAFDGLRIKVIRRPVLVAGPYVGELGHEIMDWQSYVRALRPLYREVHVITYPGREALYEGCIVHSHDILLENAGYFYGDTPVRYIESCAHRKAKELGLTKYDVFHTGHLCTRYHRRLLWRQVQEKFVESPVDKKIRDVVFHFRKVNKVGADNSKNYDPERAKQLWNLCKAAGFQTACIGHPQYSFCPSGCDDLRFETLTSTIAAICSAKIVVGELSGPMHLAMFCGKPIITWVPDAWRMLGAYRRNPFNVKILLVTDQTTQANPVHVFNVIKKEMSC